MSTPTSAGWYDDPEAPDQLRYFDGIVWTSHTTPRRTRQDPAQQQAAEQAAQQAARHQPGALGGVDVPSASSPSPPGGSGTPNPYGPPPTYGTAPPVLPHHQTVAAGPRTMDGVPLAGYGQRVGAFAIDGLIKFVVNLVLGGWAAYLAIKDSLDSLLAQIDAGQTSGFDLSLGDADPRWLSVYALITATVGMAYSVFFLTRSGATPGKKAVGISVRRTGRAGPLDMTAAVRRYTLPYAVGLFGNVPVISAVLLGLWCVDHLFPLVDDKRQSWHDKIGDTQVVRGPQPQRNTSVLS